MRYFDKTKKNLKKTAKENTNELKVTEGGLAEPKVRRPKHLVERKKQKDHYRKIARLGKEVEETVNDNKTRKLSVYEKLAEKKINQNENKSKKGLERVPVPEEKLKFYGRGDGIKGSGIKTVIDKKKLILKDKSIQWAAEQSARAEILLTEESGIIEADQGEITRQYKQREILDNVDITTAAKSFELQLRKFGPYCIDFTRNGRQLVIGGKKGHLAAFDWVTKKLMFEINVMENIFDVHWLHNENMVAAAQKEWVYIYDQQGVEIHCLKKMNRVLRLEFLPYHFLLTSVNEDGWLSWLDVSIGKFVAQTSTHIGRPLSMVQNPHNACICLGSSKGVVSMWSPSVQKPLAKMLCHNNGVQGLAIDSKGLYMATSAPDHTLKVWDIRNLEGPLQYYKLRSAANHLAFSQQGLLATALGNVVEVYKDCCSETADKPYLKHRANDAVFGMKFSPYEDILGLGTSGGYQSILVPGSGEPNFDAYEANPFQTKKQRREAEVKALLDKIQPDLIGLDPTAVMQVDVPTLKEKLDAKKELLFVKPPTIDFTPRMKKKKHGNTVRMSRSKKIVKAEAKREFVKLMKVHQELNGNNEGETEGPVNVLDRFKPKRKKLKVVPL